MISKLQRYRQGRPDIPFQLLTVNFNHLFAAESLPTVGLCPEMNFASDSNISSGLSVDPHC